MPETAQIPPIRVIIVREGDIFVAQCLEFDVAAHGSTPDEAREAFVHALIGHVLVAVSHDDDPFGDQFRSVPVEYGRIWDRVVAADDASIASFDIPHFTIQQRSDFDDSRLPHSARVLVADAA